MKKLALMVLPVCLIFTACTAMDTTGTAQTSSGSSQLGMAALKVAVNVQCLNKIETLPAWKSATKVMSNEQKQSIQTEVCGCVSEKAPYSVTTMDIATASLDPAARATIVNQIVTKTVSECVVQTLN